MTLKSQIQFGYPDSRISIPPLSSTPEEEEEEEEEEELEGAAGNSQPSIEGQAYAIGIGYSYDKCVEKGPPTKFIKITTPEFFKWLTQKRENIIDVNHKECTLGKGASTKHVESKGGA